LSLFISSFTLFASTEEIQPIKEIIWLQSNTPPFFTPKHNKAPLGGICNELTDQLISSISTVKHTRLTVPQKRISKLFNDGAKVCFTCLIHKNTSTRLGHYSVPTTIYPAFSIISTHKTATKIKEKHGDPVNLINLLSDPAFLYGHTEARKFTPTINKIIENMTTYNKASFTWSSENESKVVMERLAHDFIDYSIDYPFMSKYFSQFKEFETIVYTPIANNNNDILGAVGCAAKAPQDFAKQAIELINTALKNHILISPKYLQSQLFWLNDEDNFSNNYEEKVLKIILPKGFKDHP
jgi:uncharacterized protein (TIGR02285 family)